MRPDLCPFCRGDRLELAIVKAHELSGSAQVRCASCNAQGPKVHGHPHEEIEMAACESWNAVSRATREEARRAE